MEANWFTRYIDTSKAAAGSKPHRLEACGVIEKLWYQHCDRGQSDSKDESIDTANDMACIETKMKAITELLRGASSSWNACEAAFGLGKACESDRQSAQLAMESGSIPWLVQLLWLPNCCIVAVAAQALCAILTALNNDASRLVALVTGIVPAVNRLLTEDSTGQAWNSAVDIALFLSQGNAEVREVIASSGIVGGLCRIVKAGNDTHPVHAVHAATIHAALASLGNLSVGESEVARMAIADCGVLPILVQLVFQEYAEGAQQAAGENCRALGPPLQGDNNRLRRRAAVILQNVSRGSHGVRMAAIDAGALRCASRAVLRAVTHGAQLESGLSTQILETCMNLLHAHLEELSIRRQRAREEAEQEASVHAREAAEAVDRVAFQLLLRAGVYPFNDFIEDRAIVDDGRQALNVEDADDASEDEDDGDDGRIFAIHWYFRDDGSLLFPTQRVVWPLYERSPLVQTPSQETHEEQSDELQSSAVEQAASRRARQAHATNMARSMRREQRQSRRMGGSRGGGGRGNRRQMGRGNRRFHQ